MRASDVIVYEKGAWEARRAALARDDEVVRRDEEAAGLLARRFQTFRLTSQIDVHFAMESSGRGSRSDSSDFLGSALACSRQLSR